MRKLFCLFLVLIFSVSFVPMGFAEEKPAMTIDAIGVDDDGNLEMAELNVYIKEARQNFIKQDAKAAAEGLKKAAEALEKGTVAGGKVSKEAAMKSAEMFKKLAQDVEAGAVKTKKEFNEGVVKAKRAIRQDLKKAKKAKKAEGAQK